MRTAEASIEVARPPSSILLSSGHPATSPLLVYIDWCTHPTFITIDQTSQCHKAIQFNLSLVAPILGLIGSAEGVESLKGNDDRGDVWSWTGTVRRGKRDMESRFHRWVYTAFASPSQVGIKPRGSSVGVRCMLGLDVGDELIEEREPPGGERVDDLLG
jgi:hypothetical protein